MKNHFGKIIKRLSESSSEDASGEDYIEINSEDMNKSTAKIMLKYFTLNDFSDVKPVLDALRAGYTIGLIKISPLKEKDISELKRAVSKIKKTCYALEGELIGIDQNWLVAVPSYVSVYREKVGSEQGAVPVSTDDFDEL
ncbi:MAG: cell division protein SepF [Nanoarchaeota archaeon]|nr:cell division protein SepF [Nanoarchaeota archaeon]